jgi:hypothetical protein
LDVAVFALPLHSRLRPSSAASAEAFADAWSLVRALLAIPFLITAGLVQGGVDPGLCWLSNAFPAFSHASSFV